MSSHVLQLIRFTLRTLSFSFTASVVKTSGSSRRFLVLTVLIRSSSTKDTFLAAFSTNLTFSVLTLSMFPVPILTRILTKIVPRTFTFSST